MSFIRKCNTLVCLLVLLYGCGQHELVPQSLTGDWLWVGTSGGLVGASIKPAPTDRVLLRFIDANHFAVFQHDTLVRTGNFHLTKEQSIYSGNEENKITVDGMVSNNPSGKASPLVIDGIIVSLSPTQLSIGDNAYDGYGSSFTRQ